jgi:hypothetical protein
MCKAGKLEAYPTSISATISAVSKNFFLQVNRIVEVQGFQWFGLLGSRSRLRPKEIQ